LIKEKIFFLGRLKRIFLSKAESVSKKGKDALEP
jgi:hypothetical protein